jgi:nucleoside-diphosphate-sugar epimerase
VRLLLVGHDGYVGSGLERALRATHDIVGWGRTEDIARIDATAVHDRQIDAVVNCAAVIDRTNEALSPESPSTRVNIDGVRALVAALRGTAVRLIQISTREVYGPVFGPGDLVEREDRLEPMFLVDEDQPPSPRTAYAKSKLAAEVIAREHAHATIIRLSTCYTDHFHERGGWMLDVLKRALRGQPITVNGGKQVRDPLHVDDLARLIEQILSADVARLGRIVVNAGGGQMNLLSVREIVALLAPGAEVRSGGPGDLGFALDNTRAIELTGWQPEIRLADRVERMRKNVEAALQAGVSGA